MRSAQMPNSAARELHLLRILEREPDLTQRQLAHEAGISLGGVNHCLSALVEKGLVKVKNFAKSPNKIRYAYVLTPYGVAEKAALTRRFLASKLAEYEALRVEIEKLEAEANRQ